MKTHIVNMKNKRSFSRPNTYYVSRGLTPAFLFGQLLARTNEGASGIEPTHANAPIYPVFPGIRPPYHA